MSSAWKVGAFVLVFVGLFLGAFAVLQKSFFTKEKEDFVAVFDDAGGLTTGSVVLYAGVKVGEVSKVELTDQNTAKVILALDKGTKVPKGTTAVLPGSFISIGDRQVLLKPPMQVAGYLSAGDSQEAPIPGVLQGPLDSVFPDSAKTVEELNKTMVAFQDLLKDKDLHDGLVNAMKAGTDTLKASQVTAEKFGNLAGSLDASLNRNAGKIDSMMSSLAASMQDLQAVSLKIREIATDGKLEAQANDLLATITDAAKEGKGLVQDLRSYTSDPEMKDSLKGTLLNFESMSQSGVRIATDAEVMSKNGIEISQKTNELLTKANKLADQVSTALEDLKGAVSKVAGDGKQGLIPPITVETDLMHQSEPAHIRSDVNLTMPIGKESLTFGLYDAFESNKINLMLGKSLSDKLDFRYGVYASKPGLGVSYAVAPKLWFRTDLFGLNDTQLDFRLRYDFAKGIHGWAGIERLFDQNSPAIGIGITH